MSNNSKYLLGIAILGIGGYMAYKYLYKPKPKYPYYFLEVQTIDASNGVLINGSTVIIKYNNIMKMHKTYSGGSTVFNNIPAGTKVYVFAGHGGYYSQSRYVTMTGDKQTITVIFKLKPL